MKKYLLVLLFLPLLCLVPSEDTPVTPNTEVAQYQLPVVTYRQDPQVVEVMQNLGLDYSKLNLVYGDGQVGAGSASFTQPNTIYLSPQLEPRLINVAISHEYIHYVQTQDIFADNTFLTALYNGPLYNRMSFYRTDYCPSKNCLSLEQEAQAYACTELPTLRADLEAWCDKHLPNRQALIN